MYASVTVLDNTPKHNRAFVDIEQSNIVPELVTPCLEWQYSAGLAIWTFRQQLRRIAYTEQVFHSSCEKLVVQSTGASVCVVRGLGSHFD